jgi:hypothetical protein
VRDINYRFNAASLGLCLALLSPLIAAHTGDPTVEEPPPEIEEVVVEGRRENLAGETRSASEGVVGQSELRNRPLLRPGDVMESIPNLIMTQHSGTGKGNQMFLRGFNLDHGTDFATWVDGMPVNLRSHGHGQGYTDINFLIPELVRFIDYRKGPYYSELGDFSSAGGAHIRHYERLPGGQIRIGVGENGYRRALAAADGALAGGKVLGAFEAKTYDGPWTDISEDLEKLNGMLRWSRDGDRFSTGITAMFYDADWNSADQIPERAVVAGLIDPLGSLDTTVGGNTRRASLSGRLNWARDGADQSVELYLIDYRMQLWSNFTYLLNDPVDGDQFEQFDDRLVYGGQWRREWLGGGSKGHIHHRLGAELRRDDIDGVGLFQTVERRRIDTVRLDRVDQTSVGAFYEMEYRFNDHWRTVLGLRADGFWFDVQSDRAENSGDASDAIVSPKANLVYRFDARTEAYLSAGAGFHSNDARGTTIRVDPVTEEPVAPVDPLVRSLGAETGFRWQPLEGWNASVAAWYLELDSELLYVGDAGNTEASRPSRRYGLEWNNFWQVNETWTLEADLAWTDARFTEPAPEGDEVPGAVRTVVSAAATAEFPSGWFGQLRYRYFGGAPLIEDGSVESEGSSMVNLSLGWQGSRWRLQLDVLNLLDSSDRDIEYYYASRLPGEPLSGVEDIHFHAFEPRQFRAYLSWAF